MTDETNIEPLPSAEELFGATLNPVVAEQAVSAVQPAATDDAAESVPARTMEEIEAIIRKQYFANADGSINEEEFQEYKKTIVTPALERLDKVYGGLDGWIKNRFRTSDEGIRDHNDIGLALEDTMHALTDIFGADKQYVHGPTGDIINEAKALTLPENEIYVRATESAPELGTVLAKMSGGIAENGLYGLAAIGSTLGAIKEGATLNWHVLDHDNREVAWAVAAGVKQVRDQHGDFGLGLGAWLATIPEMVTYFWHSITGTEESAAAAKEAWDTKFSEIRNTDIGETQLSAMDFVAPLGVISAAKEGLAQGSANAAYDAFVGHITEKAHRGGTRQEVRVAAGVMKNDFNREVTAFSALYTGADAANKAVEPERSASGFGDTTLGEDASEIWDNVNEDATSKAITVGSAAAIADMGQKYVRGKTSPDAAASRANKAVVEAQEAVNNLTSRREADIGAINSSRTTEAERRAAQASNQGSGKKIADARLALTQAQEDAHIAVSRAGQAHDALENRGYVRNRLNFVLGDPRTTNGFFSGLKSGVGSGLRGVGAGTVAYYLIENQLPVVPEKYQDNVAAAATAAGTAELTVTPLAARFAGALKGGKIGLKPTPAAVLTTAAGAAVGFFFPNQVEAAGDALYAHTFWHFSEEAKSIRRAEAWQKHNGDALLQQTILDMPLLSPQEMQHYHFGAGGARYSAAIEAKYALNEMLFNAPEPLTREHIEAVQKANATLLENTQSLVLQAIQSPTFRAGNPAQEIEYMLANISDTTIENRQMLGEYIDEIPAIEGPRSTQTLRAELKEQAQSIEEAMIRYGAAVETFRGSDAGKQWIAELEAEQAQRIAEAKARAAAENPQTTEDFLALLKNEDALFDALPDAHDFDRYSHDLNTLISFRVKLEMQEERLRTKQIAAPADQLAIMESKRLIDEAGEKLWDQLTAALDNEKLLEEIAAIQAGTLITQQPAQQPKAPAPLPLDMGKPVPLVGCELEACRPGTEIRGHVANAAVAAVVDMAPENAVMIGNDVYHMGEPVAGASHILPQTEQVAMAVAP